MQACDATLHEILAALRTAEAGPSLTSDREACALCALIHRSVERSVRALCAEFVNDPAVREEFRRAGGFCREHTRLLTGPGDALAVAILYSDLARLTRERWLAADPARKRGPLRLGRPRSVACPGCAAAQDAAQRYVAALAAGLDVPAVWEALERDPGLCVVHTEEVLARAKPSAAARLRRLEAARLAALQAELDEIVRKNDYRFREEPWGAEKDAWLRALKKLTR